MQVGDARRLRVALVTVAPLVLAGCGIGHQAPTVPDVTGQTGRAAVEHLHDAGVHTVAFTGRWNPQPMGTVLTQRPQAGSSEVAKVTLVASMGPRRTTTNTWITVPGIATCDLTPIPAGSMCVGGPVLLRPPPTTPNR